MSSSPHYASPDETAVLWRGDALAVLAQLDTASVDALITDPPYSSGGMVRGDRAQGTGAKYLRNDSASGRALADFTGDNRDQRGYAHWCALWLAEARRVTRPGGVAVLFTDWRQLPATTDALQAGGWVWRGIVPWRKPAARPQLGRFTASCEYAVWGSNGPMPTNEHSKTHPGWVEGSPPRDRVHQTQKPLEVMRALCRIVPPGGVILDPFAGSGTTGAAALLEDRRFVGVEESPTYADVAAERLATIARGYALTADEPLPLDVP